MSAGVGLLMGVWLLGTGALIGWVVRSRWQRIAEDARPTITVSVDWDVINAAAQGAGFRLVPTKERTVQ